MANPEFSQRTLPSYLCHVRTWTRLFWLLELATKDSHLPGPVLAALALALGLIEMVLSHLPAAGQKERSTEAEP